MNYHNDKDPLPNNRECSSSRNNDFHWIIISKVYPPDDIVIISFLKSYGIPVKISRKEIPQFPVAIGPLGETHIAVPEQMVEKARDLLESISDSPL
ncbi:MAG TPA: hypothetical protein VFC96_06285 [Anaerovoracaceae bacterium]|nr:hypothetical protein [Anaerovoracaceae bacterium]